MRCRRPAVRPGLPSRAAGAPSGRRRGGSAADRRQRQHRRGARRVLPEHRAHRRAAATRAPRSHRSCSPPNRVWSLGAGLTQPIFDGGALLGPVPPVAGALRGAARRLSQDGALRRSPTSRTRWSAVQQTAEQVERQQQAATQARPRLRVRADADARRHHQRADPAEYGDRAVQRPGRPGAGEIRAPAGAGVAVPGTRRRLAAGRSSRERIAPHARSARSSAARSRCSRC